MKAQARELAVERDSPPQPPFHARPGTIAIKHTEPIVCHYSCVVIFLFFVRNTIFIFFSSSSFSSCPECKLVCNFVV